ncbi:TIR domain-containing protein [Polaromonas sp.]|uniref:TIR domain-containing protein n=1 Tax=Polaromonas sp. TaxID=1869339 RepID=UPI00272F1487|nr:TIR domain-containing protein [Polaromonas sp.]MDP1743108.1 TIR domain-containing protein [Polaromonas sp.]
MTRNCFYSFHYVPDCVRASQVRQIGSIEGNKPARDNDWETVVGGGDAAIHKWIDEQMKGCSCTIVLVGAETANRKWINEEIAKSWNKGMGVVGIRIHGLKNFDQQTSTKGDNPFDYVHYGTNSEKLSSIVKCYDPAGVDSKARYAWIETHLANAVEEAIKIRNSN